MERSERVRALERAAFKIGNTYVIVPLLRAGLGHLISSPLTGYFLLLRTTGRKSGLPRDTPLNYAIDGGAVICLAGFGVQAHWLQNICSDPHVHVRLPDHQGEGVATLVADRAEARRLAVAVARNCGFALVFEHPRCLLMSDAQLATRLDGRPVVRIELQSGPVVAGPYDPGGSGWVLPMLGQLVALLLLARWLGRRTGRGPWSGRAER
ncbi:MAG: nitroreductase family deazaflavin-dependent oxidoreductase [Chloroflexales bacterium]|nr:nitroreductase family deazaflavin-dependent oxidoreductase [Chloroflexales bacterium]